VHGPGCSAARAAGPGRRGAGPLDRGVRGLLVTKHGLSDALRSEDPGPANLHALLLDELVPACSSLLVASQEAGAVDPRLDAYTLLRAVGNLCISGPGYGREQSRAMVDRLLAGCRIQATDAP
jgi:hypothetical protein